MRQDIPLTDDELKRLLIRIKRQEESPDVLDLLSDDEIAKMESFEQLPTRPVTAEEFTDKPDYSGVSKALDWLPAAGGAVGGTLGAAGGFGVGSVPLGIAGAAGGGATGEALRQHGRRILGLDAPGSATAAAGGLLKEGAIQGGAQAAGAGIGKALSAGAPWLMQTALKPTQAVLKEYQTTPRALVKTLLDEGVNVTQRGIEKLQALFASTNDEIAQLVRNAPGSVKKTDVAARTLTTANKLAQQTNPTSDLRAVGETVEEFINHPVYSGKTLSVPEAQAMKVGTYRQIGKKYGEQSSASVEAQKALARGLKEEVASEVPGISALNAKDSQIMAAMDAVGRRVAVAGNRDPVGFAWVAQNPATFLAALFDRNPAIKSMIARGAYRSAGAAAGVSPQLIRIAVTGVASTNERDEPPPQE
jgi:hypothetical protein